MVFVPGGKIVWVGFDVATHFSDIGSLERAYCKYEFELVESFEKLLVCTGSLPWTPDTKTVRTRTKDRAFRQIPSTIDWQA